MREDIYRAKKSPYGPKNAPASDFRSTVRWKAISHLESKKA
jgi:hypothetical protein